MATSDLTLAQRKLLVETGTRLFHERGYTATGVRQVAAAADVPQGSFTNHFRSKESFGLAVLDNYVERLETIMQATLRDGTRTPADRIDLYFKVVEQSVAARNWHVGCLIPDLAAEVPAHSDALRDALMQIIERQAASFADVLREIADPIDADDTAAILMAAWHGTLLRMKVERNGDAIVRFRRALRRVVQALARQSDVLEPPSVPE
jgi:TetR/AcrR family transcriptional repressor of nem operon